MAQTKKLIGEILVEEKIITPAQLEQAILEQKKTGVRLGQIFLKLGSVTEKQLASALSKQLNVPYVDLETIEADPDALKKLPEDFCDQHHIFPLKLNKAENKLTLAMADPLDIYMIDEAEKLCHLKIDPCVSTELQITQAISKYYGQYQPLGKIVANLTKESTLAEEIERIETTEELASIEEAAQKAPIIDLVNTLISQAVKFRASDIHVEPEPDRTRVRYRIDGILQEASFLPKGAELAVISRIKIMSGLDIAERRIPQDGRIRLKSESSKADVDLRVSSLPILYGEKIVMRIMDTANVYVQLEKLGFLPDTLKKFEELISKPHGIILVTGPTGCGKSSTLYACLSKINSPGKNIVTIEDPIEFPIRGINQVQINLKAGLTFASGLRAFLRQDPNVIMVGEIRDLETAEIAVHAALTGHLVFSTLHTNDAPGAITRLIDMGVEPFLVASSVIGVLAQRLVRIICDKCREEYTLPSTFVGKYPIFKDGKVYRGKGCFNCRETGYFGRKGIFELMVINEAIAELVMSKAATRDIRREAIKSGMKNLLQDGFEKVLAATTTLAEILRVTQEEEAE